MLLPHARAVGAFLALVTTPAFAQRDAGILEGDHFRVVPHPGAESGALAEELVLTALETAEAAWIHATEAYGLDPEVPIREPLRIHLYRDRAAFDDACFRCEGSTWPNNSGLTSGNWGIALIHVGRGLSDEALAAVGLTDADRELVAHEATHLLGSHLAPGYRAHPSWLTEGVAEWVAQRSTRATNGEAGRRPTIDSRLAHLRERMSRDELPGLWALLRDELDALDTYQRYALYGSFVGFLLAGADAPALERVLRTTDADAEPGEVRRLFVSGLGVGGLGGLEQRFLQDLAQSTPEWTLESGVLQGDGKDGWWQLATVHQPAAAWRLPDVREAEYSLTGGFTLSSGTQQRMEIRLGRGQDPGPLFAGAPTWREHYLAVTFGPDGVSVGARDYRRESDMTVRQELLQAQVSLEPGTQHRFRITARDGMLLVQVNDEPQLEVRVGQRSTLGQWGVSATPGSFGRWANLRLER